MVRLRIERRSTVSSFGVEASEQTLVQTKTSTSPRLSVRTPGSSGPSRSASCEALGPAAVAAEAAEGGST